MTFDMTLKLCEDDYRRIILAALATKQRSLSVSDLRNIILNYSYNVSVADASEEILTETQISLHHIHIPKLESAGVIEYDSEQELVVPTEHFKLLQPHIFAILRIDPNLDGSIEL